MGKIKRAKKTSYFWNDLKSELFEENFDVDVDAMAKKHKLSTSEILIAIEYYSKPQRKHAKDETFNVLGCKSEAYFKESEMLLGFRYNINDLTGWELEEFLKRKNKQIEKY